VALLGLGACSSLHEAGPRALRVHDVTLGEAATPEDLQARFPGIQCAPMGDGNTSCATMLPDPGWMFFSVILRAGRVEGFVAEIPTDRFESFVADLVQQLGGPHVHVTGRAGPDQGAFDQVGYTWDWGRQLFVRAIKRGPWDPHRSAFIAVTGAAPEAGKDSNGKQCGAFPLLCPTS